MKRGMILLSVGLILSACGKGESSADTPKGQVVATVDGQEITTSELDLEKGQVPNDPAIAARAQEAALQRLINRKLLVAEAKKRELDKTPAAAMFKARAEELAMVQLLQMMIARDVPKVSDDEVTQFISAHPATFAQRRLVSVDQLLVPNINAKLIKQLEPIKTMPEVEALLNSNQVKFVRSAAVLDTLNLDPDTAAKVGALAADEVIAIPGGGGVQIARITNSRVEPLSGDDALKVARGMLSMQRGAKQVQEAMEDVIKRGQSSVKINASFAPKGQPAPKN